MKIILLSAVAVFAIAIGGNLILNSIGFSSESQNSGSSVRLDENTK